jgi:hypothetical protein
VRHKGHILGEAGGYRFLAGGFARRNCSQPGLGVTEGRAAEAQGKGLGEFGKRGLRDPEEGVSQRTPSGPAGSDGLTSMRDQKKDQAAVLFTLLSSFFMPFEASRCILTPCRPRWPRAQPSPSSRTPSSSLGLPASSGGSACSSDPLDQLTEARERLQKPALSSTESPIGADFLRGALVFALGLGLLAFFLGADGPFFAVFALAMAPRRLSTRLLLCPFGMEGTSIAKTNDRAGASARDLEAFSTALEVQGIGLNRSSPRLEWVKPPA